MGVNSLFYTLSDLKQEMLAIPNAMQRISILDTTLPGEFEVLLDLHDAYVNARTIAIKTDESMASLTKMVQLFSRDERIPAVTPRFCRQLH